MDIIQNIINPTLTILFCSLYILNMQSIFFREFVFVGLFLLLSEPTEFLVGNFTPKEESNDQEKNNNESFYRNDYIVNYETLFKMCQKLIDIHKPANNNL